MNWSKKNWSSMIFGREFEIVESCIEEFSFFSLSELNREY